MTKFPYLLITALMFLLIACRVKSKDKLEPAQNQETLSSISERVTPAPTPAQKADADVIHVRAVQDANDGWIFHVTVAHPDIGWDDYADGWDVVTLDGIVLKYDSNLPFTRLLAHPHVDEQPFTRSQRGIIIPENVTHVIVRAHDIVDGFGGQEILVDLEKDSGEGYEVERK